MLLRPLITPDKMPPKPDSDGKARESDSETPRSTDATKPQFAPNQVNI